MTNCPINVEPLSQSEIIQTPKINNFNYTNQDFYSMKTRFIDFILERFGPNGTVIPNTFNDLVESDLAIMLIETMAFLGDTLSFKIDQNAQEPFIDTVTEVENAFRLAKLVGFQPQPPIAARSFWSATINNPLTTDLSISTPIIVDIVSEGRAATIELFQMDANKNPLFDEGIIVPAGSTVNNSVIGLEGRTNTQEFTGTGEIAQTITLTNSPVIFDSIRVDVDGIGWTQVEYFTDSQPRREYRVEFNSDYEGFIIFGNNRSGLIPSAGSRITVTYRVGGGTIGNIVTGFVETQRQVSVPGLAFNVPISFRNYTKGEFGYDGDTIDDIRNKLPAWARTQNRAVTGLDYKTLADQFSTAYHGQIGKSTAVLRNYGCAANIIDLYVLAKDGISGLTNASNELKVDLNEEINNKKMLTDFVCIRDGAVIEVDTSVEVTIDKFYKKFEEEIRTRIVNKIDSFFSINNWEYGKSLRDVDIIKQLSDIREPQGYEINFVTNDENNQGVLITAKFYEIIRPDIITVSFVYI